MAGKTKVNLEFAVSDNTTQTVSFEVPNGVDGKDGAAGAKGDKGATGAKGDTGVGITTVTVTSSQVA